MARPSRASRSAASPPSGSGSRPRRPVAASREVVEIHTTDDDDDEPQIVERPKTKQKKSRRSDTPPPVSLPHEEEEDDLEMEEVDISNGLAEYAAVHQEELQQEAEDQQQQQQQDANGEHQAEASSSTSRPAIFYDGKGQSAAGALSLSFAAAQAAEAEKKKRTNILTPRDRAVRLDGHKLHVLALLAHAKLRNRWLNDDDLRDHLYNMSPKPLRDKLRLIHPKRTESQRERVRLFEAFLNELVRWWAVRFYLDPDMSAASAIRQPNSDLLAGIFPRNGRRVDGWMTESSKEREFRQAKARKDAAAAVKGKGKAAQQTEGGREDQEDTPRRRFLARRRKAAEEITIFPPGTDETARPALLRLLPPVETIASPADLLEAADRKAGSRETSAQLFCALCRALGIPARLVISPQVAPWSIGAGKVGQTAGALSDGEGKMRKKSGRSTKGKKSLPTTPSSRFASRKGTDQDTSDGSDFEGPSNNGNYSDGISIGAPSASGVRPVTLTPKKTTPKKEPGSASRPVSIASANTSAAEEEVSTSVKKNGRPKRAAASSAAQPIQIKDESADESVLSEAHSTGAAKAKPQDKGKKGKGKAKAKKDEDYRDEKWKGLTAPLEIEFKPKLRTSRPAPTKETALEPQDLTDVDPVDLSSPPTMWVEVFSKPFQRWITVDPVRARVVPTGNRQMEPLPQDKSNKLVYVVAFEEDGFARDVTARYTKTLHSRVSRMRPPAGARKGAAAGDWWESVVAAIHRPQRLERDAAEDLELEEAAGKEPMPNSVGGFKDHPVFALERHLKRDETLHPATQIGTFQGIPVFHRKNVLTLRSARQWYNEGKVIKEGEEALKWVKSRGYTLANRRAEEQARAEGEEVLQEGLYAAFQTELYRPPAVINGIVPKNHYGNIDLFVPSMLPEGAVHIPYNGSAKIAKKLDLSYAEAIIGFEFRKHRSNPKMLGIVVAEEVEDMVLDAYWTSESAAVEKEMNRQQERALKNWRKVFNALRIKKRLKEQYGGQQAASSSTSAGADQSSAVMEEDASMAESSAGPATPTSAPSSSARKGKRRVQEVEEDVSEVAASPSPAKRARQRLTVKPLRRQSDSPVEVREMDVDQADVAQQIEETPVEEPVEPTPSLRPSRLAQRRAAAALREQDDASETSEATKSTPEPSSRATRSSRLARRQATQQESQESPATAAAPTEAARPAPARSSRLAQRKGRAAVARSPSPAAYDGDDVAGATADQPAAEVHVRDFAQAPPEAVESTLAVDEPMQVDTTHEDTDASFATAEYGSDDASSPTMPQETAEPVQPQSSAPEATSEQDTAPRDDEPTVRDSRAEDDEDVQAAKDSHAGDLFIGDINFDDIGDMMEIPEDILDEPTERPVTPPPMESTPSARVAPETPEAVRIMQENRLKAKDRIRQQAAAQAREQQQLDNRRKGPIALEGAASHGSASINAMPSSSRNAADNGRLDINPATGRPRLPNRAAQANDDPNAPLPRDKSLGDYIEFDLSKLHNSKGGFLIDEDDIDGITKKSVDDIRKERERERQRIREAMEPSIILDDRQEICDHCGSKELNDSIRRTFGVKVCRICERKFPEKYSLLTKTEVKEDYLLNDGELRDGELLPHLLKANPHKSTYSNMMLFLRCQVEVYAFGPHKWGSEAGLDEEFERRQEEKSRKRGKKFMQGLQELRKRTRDNVWQKRVDTTHRHEYVDEGEEVDGVQKQVCQGCGHEIQVETF